MIGGCLCGTNVPPITAARSDVAGRSGRGKTSWRPRLRWAAIASWVPSIASLYGQVALAPGERLFLSDRRTLQREVASRPSGSSSRSNTIGTACIERGPRAGTRGSPRARHPAPPLRRPARRDRRMDAVVEPHARRHQMRRLVIDSTALPFLESAGSKPSMAGKRLLNSINFEGRPRAPGKSRWSWPRRFGTAGSSPLTIADTGNGPGFRSTSSSIARRLRDFASAPLRLPESDLLFDPLDPSLICHRRNDDDRNLGLWTPSRRSERIPAAERFRTAKLILT